MDGKIKDTAIYRKEIIGEIESYIQKQEGITDILIAGDYNQDITAAEMKHFYYEINDRNIHQSYNLILESELDKTHIRGSKCINSITGIQNLLDFVEGLKLLEASDITITGYRAILIDINFDSYFEEIISSWDQINHLVLNLGRQ